MHSIACRRTLFAVLALLGIAVSAGAQPAITATTGSWTHDAAITIAGSGFGVKAGGAPVVWDDASGSDVAATWDGAWPNCAGNAGHNLAYRTPSQVGRNIPLPHTRRSRYIAGAHFGPTPGPQCSYAVILWKTRTITSFPAYSYISYYQRADDNWHFGTADDNFKTFAYSDGVGPYNLPDNWYVEYNPRPTSRDADVTWHLNDDGNVDPSLRNPDRNHHNHFWEQAINPMQGAWTKIEIDAKYTNEEDGYVKLWENGTLKIDYAGRTDNYAPGMRTEGIGGYSSEYPFTSNWRYFADVYLDYSRARVILGNAPSLAASTIRELQIPSSWSESAIGVSVNLGVFAPGQTAYLFVVDPEGRVNAAGIPIAVAAGGTTADTLPPTVSLSVPSAPVLSGVVSLTATAADNVGVAGVQVRIDGVAVGPEDTAAPYALDWNSATATNGTHVLTVVARDAAGNEAVSAAVTVTTANVSAPTTTGLVAAFAFAEGAGTGVADVSGHGHGATVGVGATWEPQGRHGGAMRFDGAGGMVTVADAADLRLDAGLTLEAWVNPSADSGWRTVVLKEADGGLAYALYANDGTGRPAVSINTGGFDMSLVGPSPLPLDAWSHLAATYDGRTLRLFVDGGEVASRDAGGFLVVTTRPLRIGGNTSFADEFFAGVIDDLRIYTRALSAAEIEVDMATAVVPPGPPPSHEEVVFGPHTYAGRGHPVLDTSRFVADGPGTWRLRVANQGVKAAVILLNGRLVVGPRNLGSQADVPIAVRRGTNTLVVAFPGKRGTSLTVAVVRIPPDPPPPPPQVTIAAPVAGSALTEKATMTVTVEVSGAVPVTRVDLAVNGAVLASDTTAPYQFLFTVPAGVSWVAFRATAVDDRGVAGTSAETVIEVAPDPGTTVRGRVVDGSNRAATGADVSLDVHGLTAEIFDFTKTLTQLPKLSTRTPSRTTTVTAASLRNPNFVFGADPFGFGTASSRVVRLSGRLQVARGGIYRFTLGVNEGGVLRLGGVTVVKMARGTGAFQRASATLLLRPGSWPIEVQAFDNGNPEIELSYDPPNGSAQVVPQSLLTPSESPFTARAGATGAFAVSGVPSVFDRVGASAAYPGKKGKTLTGEVAPVAVVPGGITDVGVIRVR